MQEIMSAQFIREHDEGAPDHARIVVQADREQAQASLAAWGPGVGEPYTGERLYVCGRFALVEALKMAQRFTIDLFDDGFTLDEGRDR